MSNLNYIILFIYYFVLIIVILGNNYLTSYKVFRISRFLKLKKKNINIFNCYPMLNKGCSLFKVGSGIFLLIKKIIFNLKNLNI
jgi:hypothetical protein